MKMALIPVVIGTFGVIPKTLDITGLLEIKGKFNIIQATAQFKSCEKFVPCHDVFATCI